MMVRYFLDANVIVSGLLWPGNPQTILELARDGQINIVVSQYVLDEVAHVFADYFAADDPDVLHHLEEVITHFSEIIEPTPADVQECSKSLTDKKDANILASAIASKSVLVTGDKKLAAEAKKFVKVFTPAELLKDF